MEGGLDTDEAKTHSKRTKEQAQAKNRNKNNAFQSDTPQAGEFVDVFISIGPRVFQNI